MLVRIHPDFSPSYCAFYLEGLRRIYGDGCLQFSDRGFPPSSELGAGLALELVDGGGRQRIYVAAGDHARLDRIAYDWCDSYGIVNYDPGAGWEKTYPKVVPIGPSFGIQSWGLQNTLLYLVRFSFRHCESIMACLQQMRNHKKQLCDRVPEQYYAPTAAEPGYVFYVSWPWKKHPEVNPPRERFIRACKSIPGIRFEGGFAPRRWKDVAGIEDITAPKRYRLREYLERVGRSCVVFNNPAVHDCLGWKLGEFLAMGKAIISLPLSRAMPAPLVHGRHVHYVQDSVEDLVAAVKLICGDDEYREHLEENARSYYLEHLSPTAVICRFTAGRR